MKKLAFLFLLISLSVFAYGQKPAPTKTPTNSSSVAKQDSVVYLSPTGFVTDTTLVYAVVASIKEPLSLSPYRIVTKYWVYKNGKQVPAEQWLEKVVGDSVLQIEDWKKRTLFIINRNDYNSSKY